MNKGYNMLIEKYFLIIQKIFFGVEMLNWLNVEMLNWLNVERLKC